MATSMARTDTITTTNHGQRKLPFSIAAKYTYTMSAQVYVNSTT